jgi:hypothetical protein
VLKVCLSDTVRRKSLCNATSSLPVAVTNVKRMGTLSAERLFLPLGTDFGDATAVPPATAPGGSCVHDYFLQRQRNPSPGPIKRVEVWLSQPDTLRRKSLCNATSTMRRRSRRSSREPGDEHERFRLSGMARPASAPTELMETERVGLVAEPGGRRQPSVVYGEGGATRHSKQLTFLLTIDAGA